MSGPGNNPPRQSGSGFWTGLELNRSDFLFQTWTAGGLPGPVANTSYLQSLSPHFFLNLNLVWVDLTQLNLA
jgi:hypothetical protein